MSKLAYKITITYRGDKRTTQEVELERLVPKMLMSSKIYTAGEKARKKYLKLNKK